MVKHLQLAQKRKGKEKKEREIMDLKLIKKRGRWALINFEGRALTFHKNKNGWDVSDDGLEQALQIVPNIEQFYEKIFIECERLLKGE